MSEKIKVAIIVSPPFVIEEKTGAGEEKKYTGFLYKIWTQIKIYTKINVEETFLNGKDLNYNELCVDISKGKYDMAVGNISVSSYREKIISFTRPVYLNVLNVVHKRKISVYKLFKELLFTTFIPPLVGIIVIGIIFGLLLYSVDPGRGRMRSILTTVTSMFGEMGYLSENSNMTAAGIAVVIVIMLIAYYYSLFLQAITIDKVIDITNKDEMTKESLNGNVFLVSEGSALGEIMKRHGAIMKEFSGDVDKLIDIYLEDPDLYSGVVVDYHVALTAITKNDTLQISTDDYGFDEIAFPVSLDKKWVIELVNESITDLQRTRTIAELCELQFDSKSAYLCDL